MANQVLTQCQHHFPLGVALQLGEQLGYDAVAMAELLPAAAIGIALALKDITDQQKTTSS